MEAMDITRGRDQVQTQESPYAVKRKEKTVHQIPNLGITWIQIERIVVWGGLLIVWEVWGRGQSPFFFTYPTAILRAGFELFKTGQLLGEIGESMQALITGFLLAASMGVSLGLLAGRFNYLRRLFHPLMLAFYVTPRLALIPLVIIWVGIGFEAKIAIIWLTCFFPIYFNVVPGMMSLSRTYLDVAHAYGADEWQTLREVILPAILPFIATALRLGLAMALVGMVTAEFFVGLTGLGGVIVFNADRLQIAQVFAAVFVILIIGVTLMSLAYEFERRVSHWQQTERAFR